MVQAFRRRPVSMLKSRAKQIVFGPWEQKAADGFGALRMAWLTQVGTYSRIFLVCSQALKTRRTKQEQSQRRNKNHRKAVASLV